MHVPLVSVLIPTYNYARYLPNAIESVLAQTCTDFELIIVDDISTDNTVEVVQPYLKDKRVSFYQNKTNLGLPENWNQCLSLAKGKYIKFLMADDSFHPELLQKSTQIFEAYPNVSLVTSYKQYISSDNLFLEPFSQPFSHLQPGKTIIRETLKTWNWIGEPTTVMFRSANLHLGVFNKNYSWIPDWDMWLRHLTVGDCYIIPEVLSYFRQHEGQATVHLGKNMQRQREEYLYYKMIQRTNPFRIDLDELEIDNILKSKSNKYLRAAVKGGLKAKKHSLATFNDALLKYVSERSRLYLQGVRLSRKSLDMYPGAQ